MSFAPSQSSVKAPSLPSVSPLAVATPPLTADDKQPVISPDFRKPPKLSSASPKRSHGRLGSQPIPKLRLPTGAVKTPDKPAVKKTAQTLSSSSMPDPHSTNAALSSTMPLVTIIRTRISSDVLRKLERDHIDHTLIDLLIADLDVQSLPVDQRHAIGRTDSAFYVDKLPIVLQSYARDASSATLSSSRLLQRVFAEEFRNNTGWATAKTLCANEMFGQEEQSLPAVGETDPEMKNAAREKLKGMAEVIAKSLFGHPASVRHSPLPRRLIEALIYADQRFHEALLTGKATCEWSSEQIRDARCSLIKLLTVTRLLMPLLTALTPKDPSQKDIWLLGLAMQLLLKSAAEFGKDLMVESFAQASPSLQRLADDKEKREQIQARVGQLTNRAKKTGGHVRSRSADTTPVSIDWLAQREKVKTKRALEKASDIASKIERVIADDDSTLSVEQALNDVMTFSSDDIKQIERMLAERDAQELIDLLPDGDVVAERAQALPTSTSDPVPGVRSATYPTTDELPIKEKS